VGSLVGLDGPRNLGEGLVQVRMQVLLCSHSIGLALLDNQLLAPLIDRELVGNLLYDFQGLHIGAGDVIGLANMIEHLVSANRANKGDLFKVKQDLDKAVLVEGVLDSLPAGQGLVCIVSIPVRCLAQNQNRLGIALVSGELFPKHSF